MSEVERRTFCRFCPSTCGVVVTVEDDRVTRVRGDLTHPLSRGYTCPKGRALGAWHHHPARLDDPLVRRDGAQAPVAWDECLGDLAAQLARISAEAPEAVGVFKGTAASFDAAGLSALRRFFAPLGSPSYYSTLTIDCASLPLVAELMAGNGALLPAASADARMVVLVGVNPIVSHGHSAYFSMPKAQLRRWAHRGDLWVVDPRRTESAEIATRHLAPRPGTDHAWLAYLVRELLEEGADEVYLAEAAQGLEELRRAVEPFGLERAARVTGLREDDLVDLVAAVRRAGRVAVQIGTGVTMAATANVAVWLAWTANVITGSQDRPGGTWFNPGGTRRLDERTWTPRDGTPSPGPPSRPELPGRHGEYPSAAIADEIESGRLRALIVFGGNIVTALPSTRRLIAALERLEVLAVLDVIENETTLLATHVLPCAGQLERADVTLLDWLLPQQAAQYAPAVLAPRARRKPSWWILAELGHRMGNDAVLPPGLTAESCTDDDMLAEVVAAGGAGIWAESADRNAADGSLFDALKAGPHGTVIAGIERFGWVHDALPEGGWRLAPAVLVEQLAALDDPEPPPLTLIAGRQLRRMNSQVADGKAGGRDGPGLRIHPDDASERGLADGAPVTVASAHGRVVTTALYDGRMARGAVWLPHGHGDANVSFLTSDREDVDLVSGMVRQTAIPVELSSA